MVSEAEAWCLLMGLGMASSFVGNHIMMSDPSADSASQRHDGGMATLNPLSMLLGLSVHQLGAINFQVADRMLTLGVMVASGPQLTSYWKTAESAPMVAAFMKHPLNKRPLRNGGGLGAWTICQSSSPSFNRMPDPFRRFGVSSPIPKWVDQGFGGIPNQRPSQISRDFSGNWDPIQSFNMHFWPKNHEPAENVCCKKWDSSSIYIYIGPL